MKVTVLLRKDHEVVKSLFTKLRNPQNRPGNGRKEAFDEVRRELALHSQMETEIFYPALENTASTSAPELLTEARKEHDRVESMLDELGAMTPGDKRFDAKIGELISAVEEHIEVEEEQIFEEARKFLPEYRLEELGLEMEARKRILNQLAA
jgi:hemerythrin superfamily protein